MRRRLTLLLTIACAAAAVFAGVQQGSAKPPPRAPRGFFGIDPQSALTDRDADYMKAGGITSVRWPLSWPTVQPTRKGGYDWSSFDPVVAVAANHGLSVLPILYGTPGWVAGKQTKLPIDNARARSGWTAFLKAAVERYKPGGAFWKEHAQTGGVQYAPEPAQPVVPRPLPIRTWQVWNEANFFYFTYPVSPQRYARLVKISSPAIKAADPGANVILSGLFGEPTAKGASGMPAAKFLEIFYRTAGIKSRFDGIALHPYAVDAETLEELVEALHDVTLANHDRVPLYITEMGWGSQNNFAHDAFEQGAKGQVKQLRGSYSYLISNRNRLDLKQVYWFSWKDLKNSCDFCDSVGLFRAGARFHAKPAWRTFLEFSRGRPRP
jgi:hypothetical protein